VRGRAALYEDARVTGGRRDPARVLQVLDGQADWAQLRRLCTTHAIRQAVAQGRILRAGKGRYVLPDLSAARRAAASVGGVLSHLSAARELGLTLLRPPDEVHVTVPRGSRRATPPGVVLHHMPLGPDDITRTSTSVLRTVTDCAISLPLAESLTVADSALRGGLLGHEDLLEAAAERRGPGRARLQRVAEHAHDDAANAFESALRAAVVEARVSGFVPQCRIAVPGYRLVVVDLGDPRRRIALEADSFAHHGGRREFRDDCRRYNQLVAAGWLVLRFTWEDVMFDAAGVGDLVARTCAHVERSV
jgi:very-short-patch-repair endonuclease